MSLRIDKVVRGNIIFHDHPGEDVKGGVVGGVIPVSATNFDVLYSPTGTEPIGSIYWNEVDGTIDMRLKNGATLQTGQELHFYGKASGAILNGELCQFAGVQGNHILVKKVVPAEIIASPHYLVGVATQNIANGDFGYVTWFGKVNGVYTKTPANNDSVDWVAGDILYFNNSTGQLTKAQPSAPNRNIVVAAVVKEQTGASENGILLIRPTFGSKLADCDDVDGANPDATGDLLTWNNGTQTWERNAYNITDYLTTSTAGSTYLTKTLNSGNIFVGNVSNVATGVTPSGDATITNAGVISVNKTRLNVRNETGTTIASTKAVYVSGFNNLPLISLATNNTEVSHNVVGITVAPIAHQADGYIAVSGQCNAETNAWTVGTELYLSTAGALTSTAPTSGSVKHIAIVTVQANYPTGKLLIYQYPEENYLAGGSGTDVIIRAGDDAATNKISFRNYSNTEVASITSTGVITGSNLSGTNTGDVTLSSPNSGLSLTSQTLSLGTPSTLTTSTTNTVTTNTHTHAITGFLPLTGGDLTGKLTLTVTNALTSGDYIGSYVSTAQSAASSGTTYAYKAEAYATHTSGTLAGLQANSTIANFTGSGGTTNYGEILTSNASVTNSAVVNTLSLVKVYTPTIHTGGSIGTLHGLYISNITGASSNYSIYSDGGSMYHAGAAVFGGTLSAPDLLVKSITDSTTTFQVQSSLSSVPILTVDTTNSRVGILTSTPSTTLSFASEATRTVAIERRTTTNVAGNSLSIQAGGATLGATDKAGGSLILRSGISTGTGSSSIFLQTYTPSTTGTTDNTLVTRATINNSGLAVAGILSLTPTTTTPNAVFTIGGTSDTANGTVMNVVTTLSGSGILTGMAFRTGFSNVGTGATILGMDFGPNITSTTGTVTTMYGTLFLPRLETTSNVAVTNAYGMYLRLDNASTAGSVVTNFYGINIAGTSGAGTVTNKYTFCAGDNAGTWLIGDANNMMLGSTTGTKIGTATTEKLGFFNATPIVQPANTTDLGTVLSNLGLRASGTAYPITTSGAVHFTGGVTIDTGNLTITDKDIVLGTTTGTKIGTATTQKLGFFNATPIVQGAAFTQTYATASHTHAAVTQLAAPAGGTGTAAGGWDTAANRNLAIASINAARTDIANVKQVLNALIDDLQALGLIA